MKTETLPFTDAIPAELEAATHAVIEKLVSGKPLDPETYRRIREQADQVRNKMFRQHGVLDIGTPSIRELRDE